MYEDKQYNVRLIQFEFCGCNSCCKGTKATCYQESMNRKKKHAFERMNVPEQVLKHLILNHFKSALTKSQNKNKIKKLLCIFMMTEHGFYLPKSQGFCVFSFYLVSCCSVHTEVRPIHRQLGKFFGCCRTLPMQPFAKHRCKISSLLVQLLWMEEESLLSVRERIQKATNSLPKK